MELATLAGGCFWCTEAIFQRLKGVEKVVSGYTGGTTENPTYEEVCSGKTGHAEAIQITFDPKVLTYKDLLTVFFKLHDPTTLNKQGADVGTQYRSSIFYHSDSQKKTAEDVVAQFIARHEFKDPIVTEIVTFKKFYEAEPNHKNFYNRNQGSSYCQIIIDPKIQKLYKEFGDMVVDKSI